MNETTTNEVGSVTGGVRTLLRLEGLVLFLGMTLLYAVWGGSWWVYFILFLAPDVSFAGYLAGPREGAIIYNAAHSYMAPVALMTTGFASAEPLVLSLAMIWLAHIGIDRALGYGLNTRRDSASPISGESGRAAPEEVNAPEAASVVIARSVSDEAIQTCFAALWIASLCSQ